MRNEYVVWGVPPGDDSETLLFTRDPATGGEIQNKATAERLAAVARDRGAVRVRIQCIDGAPPDFGAAVRS